MGGSSLMELLGQAYVFAEKRGLDSGLVTTMFNALLPVPGLHEYRRETVDARLPLELSELCRRRTDLFLTGGQEW